MSVGKVSPHIFFNFNPLDTDTPLIWTLFSSVSISVLARLAWLPLAFSNTWWPIVHIPLCLRSFFDQIYASRISTSKAPHKPMSFQIMFTKRKRDFFKREKNYSGLRRWPRHKAPWKRIRGWRLYCVTWLTTFKHVLVNQGTRISLEYETHALSCGSLCPSRSFPNVTSPFQNWSETHQNEVLSLFPADWFRLLA